MGLRATLAAACLAAATPASAQAPAEAQAQVYKCVDARGVTHYTDGPRAGCKGGPVDIRAQPPISGKLESFGTSVPDAERDFRQRQAGRDQEEAQLVKEDAARKVRCEQIKVEYQRFIGRRRIAVSGADGETVHLDGAQRDARTAQMEAQIARDCR